MNEYQILAEILTANNLNINDSTQLNYACQFLDKQTSLKLKSRIENLGFFVVIQSIKKYLTQ